MSSHDELIGTNLARLRQGMSQTELAKHMRERGHKWTQPTVVAIEKGERPLRMSEAVDASEALGADLYDLVKYPASLDFYHHQVRAEQAESQMLAWALAYEFRLRDLARAATEYEKETGASLAHEIADMDVDVSVRPNQLTNARSAVDRFVAYVNSGRENWSSEDPVTRLMREHAPAIFEMVRDGEHQAEA
ncbi:helix-turn-helix domain-containing protein [Microbacterium laevaniformans]|uniref:helix-turn-helix domain-containing protein n=1 Tax=Microbacterium laevaniformans TaxID=36807 RepID=UPI003D99B630